jgi:hypothetical protein
MEMTQTRADQSAETHEDASRSAQTGESEADLDTTFHLLQTERRRLALRYLLQRERDGDTVVEMRSVAEQVAAWENDTTVADIDADERQRAYVGLYQSHLPKLDQHDVIEYDQSEGSVELRPRCHRLAPYLDAPPQTRENGPANEDPPPADGSEGGADVSAAADGTLASGQAHLLAVLGLVPLLAVAAQIGPTVAVSGALLVGIVGLAALVGGSVQRYVGGTSVT